ncbi:hypothetical protein ACIA8G_09520 [Lentzea sp. NPDC051213]|uniref:hypothetical protein n=1 Tax=Lentzea sp. NPDC051213 TaxID=3364126 RepID=UPI0037A8B760
MLGTLVSPGVAQADQTWGFRLSNFAPQVVKICVYTDRETQCSGRIAMGKSTVYNVRFNDANNFSCQVFADVGPDLKSGQFSRNEFKECKYDDPKWWYTLYGVRPDGSHHVFVRVAP